MPTPTNTSATATTPPPVCVTCQPPESDALAMVLTAATFLVAGWLLRRWREKRRRKRSEK